MSRENVDVVQAAFAALASGDLERAEVLAREHLDTKFQLHPLYFDRVYEGLAGIQQFLSDIRDAWEDYALDLQEVIDLGERVLTVMCMSARGRGSQVPVVQ